MSIVSNLLGNGIKDFITNLFKGAISQGLDIYINTEWGRYVLTISVVDKRDEEQKRGIYWYISTDWGILLFELYPNEK